MSVNAAPTQMPIPDTSAYPPRTIQDERGEVIGVVLSRDDYMLFLRVCGRSPSHADWDLLPPYLQDAIDNMLADEASAESGQPHALRDLLAREPG